MDWLRKILLALGLAAALGIVLLDWELVWHLERFAHDARRIQDLQVLSLLLFGLAGLCSLLFLLAPGLGMQVMSRQTDRVIASIQDQLRATIAELREAKTNIEYALRDHAKPQYSAGATSGINGREYLQLAGRIRYMNTEMAQVYRALGVLSSSSDSETARAHFNQALALAADSRVTATIHYAFASVLARHGEFSEAANELEHAFSQSDPQIEELLAKDIEEGGDLYQFASTPPFDVVVDKLLMSVSVGA